MRLNSLAEALTPDTLFAAGMLSHWDRADLSSMIDAGL
jgi:hypothetical protein